MCRSAGPSDDFLVASFAVRRIGVRGPGWFAEMFESMEGEIVGVVGPV